MNVEVLQAQCWEWVMNPNKNFFEGRDLFARMVQFKPEDFWANLIYGACLTLTGAAAQGEAFIRKAKAVEDKVPHAYAMLAQNLKAQNRTAEAVAVVDELLGRAPFESVASDADHANKIIEALEVANQSLPAGEFVQRARLAAVLYPMLSNRITELSNRKDINGCCIQ